MRLESITIEGFKSIRELKNFEIRPINLLVGANGSGKTNFITAFQLLNEMLERRLQVYTGRIGAENLLYYGSKVTKEVRIGLSFATDREDLYNGYYCALSPTNNETLIFVGERYWIHDRARYPNPLITELGRGHKETRLFDESRLYSNRATVDDVITALRSWKIYHFHDTSSEAGVKRPGNINDNERLQADASNLAAFLYRLHETERPYYDRIVSTIQLVAPFFQDFNLRPNPLNPENIRLEWKEVASDRYFDANMLSDGTLRFMCLATLLLQPVLPSVILIDEPELGLHPYAIALLASLIESASEHAQIIVSTQSVPLINQFAPEEVVVVDRIDHQSTFRRVTEAELEGWLDEYGLGDLWEKNVFGGRPQNPRRPA